MLTHAAFPAETIIKVGIIACNYINEIEAKGYRTNLYSMETKSSVQNRASTSRRLKTPKNNSH